MNKCQKYEEQIALYCFGELSEQDKNMLREHIAQCADCAAQLQSIKSTLDIANKKSVPEMPKEELDTPPDEPITPDVG